MPKYCSVPNCRDESGSSNERRSFYKFPLQDPVRLQRWLKNMGRENWTPSRHQYICNEHFSPSCFKVRWGIRYLEADAVPTVFQQNQKRKAADQTDGRPKRLRVDPGQSGSVDSSVVFDGADMRSSFRTVHLYEVSVDQSQRGGFSLVDSGDVGGPDGSLQTDLDPRGPTEGEDSCLNVPLTFCHTVVDQINGSELVLVSETQNELVKGITAAIFSGSESLVLDQPKPEGSLQVRGGQEVIAYFETIPNVLPCETSTQLSSPDTVLSSALSSEPISSTLPIVSKHAPHPSLVLTLERLDVEEEGGATSKPEEAEHKDQQLEEHRYHRDSLSKEQLEAVVAELQKKVKVLQQRHRRHLEKLLGLESTVSQLRQSNLLNEERLQLLERAYQQTTSADPGETVTIIYEDDAAYFYTPTDDEETTLNVDVM